MQKKILSSVAEAIAAVEQLGTAEGVHFIEDVATAMIECYRKGGKVLIAGNGGSLCDAMHFAEELTGFFRTKRAALPALALSDPGHLTCVGNDMGFDQIFARGIEAHGSCGDIFIALTTSGNSENLVQAVQIAKEKELTVILFLGKTGGKLKGQGNHEWIVPGFAYSDRIQEAHMAAIHIIIQMVEEALFFKAPLETQGMAK